MTEYPRSRVTVFCTIALATLAIDLGSKEWVFRSLGFPCMEQPRLIDSWVRFQLHTSLNRGALWGIGQGFATGFAVLSAIAVFAIVFWLFFRNAAESLWLTIALAMVSGGAVGNMYDRLGLHGVVFPAKRLRHWRSATFFDFILERMNILRSIWPILFWSPARSC